MKKGLLVLSDMVWFLVFIIAAAFIFFLLYKPLDRHIENKVTVAGTHSDAAFIATALPRINVGSSSFSEIIVNVSEERRTNRAGLQRSTAYASYVNTLDSFFDVGKGVNMWEITPSQKRKPVLYVVVLRSKTDYYVDTCIELTPSGHRKSSEHTAFCDELNDASHGSSLHIMPGINSWMPILYISPDGTVDQDTNLRTAYFANTDFGTAYLPGPQEPVIMQVFIQYEAVS